MTGMIDLEKTKKEQIYEAAARLFRDKGYSATSMRDLAQEVSLKASSLYSHISSKEELLRDICFASARKFLQGMDEVEANQHTVVDKIRGLIKLHIRMATEDFTSVTAFNDEWRHLSEPYLSHFLELRRKYESRFRAILEEGMANGELKNLNPQVVLYTLFSSVRWLYDWYKPGKTIQPHMLDEQVVAVLLEGICNPR